MKKPCTYDGCTRNGTHSGPLTGQWLCVTHYMKEYRAKKAQEEQKEQPDTPPEEQKEQPDTPEPAPKAPEKPAVGNTLAEALELTIQRLMEKQRGIGEDVQAALDAMQADIEELKGRPPKVIDIKLADKAIIRLDGPRHRAFERVVKYVANKIPVFLVGTAGTGKSTLAKQVAEALQLDLYVEQGIQTKFDLLGMIIPQSGEYAPSQFYECWTEGGLFFLDECDSSDSQALTMYNNAIEGDMFAFPVGKVRRHEDTRFIAAGNTYGRGADRLFVGRQQLDAATLSRFAFIPVDIDEDLEDALCPNKDWLKRVRAIRRAADELKMRHLISPRASINGAIGLAAGDAWPDVEEAMIWQGLDDASRAKITAHIKK